MANIKSRLEKLEAILLQKKAAPAPVVEDHRSAQDQYLDLINTPLTPQQWREIRAADARAKRHPPTLQEAEAAYRALIGELAEVKRTTVTIAPPGVIQ